MTSEGGGEEQLLAAVSMVPSSAQSVHLDLNLCVPGTGLTLELGGTENPPPSIGFGDQAQVLEFVQVLY